jgi:hypothetical protein
MIKVVHKYITQIHTLYTFLMSAKKHFIQFSIKKYVRNTESYIFMKFY